MSLFVDLEAYPNLMRDENEEIWGEESDETLIALYQSAGLLELRSVITTVRGLRGSSADVMLVLDDLATNYSDSLRFALTYQQCAIFYDNYPDGEGSASANKRDGYLTKFRDFVSRIQRLELSSPEDEDNDIPVSFNFNIG